MHMLLERIIWARHFSAGKGITESSLTLSVYTHVILKCVKKLKIDSLLL